VVVDVELFLAVVSGAGEDLKVLGGTATLDLVNPPTDFRKHDSGALTSPIEKDVTVLGGQTL
jgi:hypothetical protein